MPIYYLPDDPTNPGDPDGTGGGTGGGPPPASSSYGTQIFGTPFTKTDGASALDITVYLNCYSADDLRFSAYLFIDDLLVNVGTTNALYDQSNSAAQGTMTVPAIVTGIPAGAHTLFVRVKNRENEAALQVQPGSLVKIAELFQAGR